MPGQDVKPAAIKDVPAVAATLASEAQPHPRSSEGGILPLAIAMLAIAIVGGVVGLRSARTRETEPPASR